MFLHPKDRFIFVCDSNNTTAELRLALLANHTFSTIEAPCRPPFGRDRSDKTLDLALEELSRVPLLMHPPRARMSGVSRNPHPLPPVPTRKRKR